MAELIIPGELEGHWSTPSGAAMAERYALKGRGDLMMGELTDLELANALFLAHGEIAIQTAAKERMRWLSVQLALANTALACANRLLEGRDRPQVVVMLDGGMVETIYTYGLHGLDCTVLDCDTDGGDEQDEPQTVAIDGEEIEAYVGGPVPKELKERFVIPEDPADDQQ